jgi:hypothetical protein
MLVVPPSDAAIDRRRFSPPLLDAVLAILARPEGHWDERDEFVLTQWPANYAASRATPKTAAATKM